jgi:NAD(P)-dependent dehydrogenase (short-subunit alcohol dehydrogenase family)
MNDTTPRTVRIVAGGSGAVGRESAERIATEGKPVVVATPATQMTTRSG